jgi:hypothetical protein
MNLRKIKQFKISGDNLKNLPNYIFIIGISLILTALYDLTNFRIANLIIFGIIAINYYYVKQFKSLKAQLDELKKDKVA